MYYDGGGMYLVVMVVVVVVGLVLVLVLDIIMVGCIGSKMKERDLWDLANRQMTVK